MLPVRRRNALAVAALLAGGAGLSALAPRHPAPARPAPHSMSLLRPLAPGAPAVDPPVAAPAPPVGQEVALPATGDGEHALRPHEIFGFAPYWNLGAAAGYPLHALTTVAYFGVDVSGDGTLLRSGAGWDGYQSAALAALVDRAHAAGAGVVLTAKQFDAATLHSLVDDPGAPARLGHELVDAVRARHMDGVNLDLEGIGGQDRGAFAGFTVAVANALHAANPRWQVTVDTYADSASDTAGYFDVARIAPAVDAFFVMAYNMQGANPSAVAPLRGAPSNDSAAVAAYAAAAGPSKVILGMPFYGVDWPTASGDRAAPASGPSKPVTYAELAAAGHPRYWDPVTAAPWTSWQEPEGQWHLAFYEDPQSIAMKAELAGAARLRGVGIWALGMDGNDPAMARAVLGHAAPVELALGPAPTPAVAPPPPVVGAAPPERRDPAPTAPPRPAPPPPAPVPAPVAPPLGPLPSPGPVPHSVRP
jgi:glycosyl hydrolase family 18 (putative chitinase)